jgi:hypothetical protein
MTRKDYVMLAAAIRESIHANPETQGAVADVATRIALKLELDNPRFDLYRFLTACGLE